MWISAPATLSWIVALCLGNHIHIFRGAQSVVNASLLSPVLSWVTRICGCLFSLIGLNDCAGNDWFGNHLLSFSKPLSTDQAQPVMAGDHPRRGMGDLHDLHPAVQREFEPPRELGRYSDHPARARVVIDGPSAGASCRSAVCACCNAAEAANSDLWRCRPGLALGGSRLDGSRDCGGRASGEPPAGRAGLSAVGRGKWGSFSI